MKLVFLQTSDCGPYLELLTASARTVRAYCVRKGFTYEAYVGLKRGSKAWHATFNRIPMLQDVLARGVHDWAVYMDADAYVADLDFDLEAYLADRTEAAAVMTPSGATDQRWDVNAGVLLINLRHPATRELLTAWADALGDVPDQLFETLTFDEFSDQVLLHDVLSSRPDLLEAVHLADPQLINSGNSRFLPQLLRSLFTDFDSRLRALREQTWRVLVRHGECAGPLEDAGAMAAATRGDVVSAYRVLLGREPEDDTVIDQHLVPPVTREALLERFFSSRECQARIGGGSAAVVFDGLHPPRVELKSAAGQLAELTTRVRRTWRRFGHARPHWSVISDERFLPERMNREDEDAFFASGAEDAAQLFSILRHIGRRPEEFASVTEFGCGLGRITNHLAAHVGEVIACDISASHLALARRRTKSLGISNVVYREVSFPDFGVVADLPLWYSCITLQHNPPPVIDAIIRRALSALAADGLAVFQVPVDGRDYRFSLDDYLASYGGGGFEMHVLPQKDVLAAVAECDCTVLDILEDNRCGPDMLSRMFIVAPRRRARPHLARAT